MEFKYLLFCSSIDLLDVKEFKRNLTDRNLIREFDVAVFIFKGISLGNGFSVVVNTR